jgi:release factor glutamine methyltransferase
MKIQDLLAESICRLETLSDTPQLDSQVLLAHITQKPRAWIISHPEHEIKKEEQAHFDLALKKLEAGEPLPYVLGKWEFFGLEFGITKDVLIPRPETELLVEKAVAWLKTPSNGQSRHSQRVADIGTGSGAIAISIAKHIPNARILATDISPAALQVAKRNAEKLNAQGQIEFVECDLLPKSKVENRKSLSSFPNPQPSTFDLICSNPPYIPTETLHGLPIFGREPTLALDGGRDGLTIYRRLLQIAQTRIAPNGILLLEIEATLGESVSSLARSSFPDSNIQLYQDLAGHDRLVQIQLQTPATLNLQSGKI